MRRFEGSDRRDARGAPHTWRETAMKRIVIALAVAALFNGTQALAEDAPIVLVSESTYAGQHAAGSPVAAFPGEAREDPIVLPSEWTYVDRSDGQAAAGSAFPGFAREDPIVVETYPETFTRDRNMQASGASDPALA